MTKQQWFNKIATVLWPQHTGDIWPGDVTMKLMEIGHEWGNAAIEEAADLCSKAEDMPESIDANNALERALVLVRGTLVR